MITRLRYPKGYQFFDSNGSPLALASLSYYVAGTTTLQDTYSDAVGTVPNSNPVVLDGSGRLDVDVYLGSAANYKEVLTTASATVSPWPDDNIPLASQPDWNATSGPGQILNKPALAAIATSGSYTDLLNTPAAQTPFIGDSGTGGSAGLVPAPAAGDAAANMFLSASGAWEALPSTSITVTLMANATAASGTTLTFASVPSTIQAGMSVSDSSASGSIPSGTTVISTTTTTVLLSQGVAGSGVASGDSIVFSGTSSVATNLSVLETSTSVSVGSSTGSGITIPAATDTAAGVLDATRSTKIDTLATVASSGSYSDLSNTPGAFGAATSGASGFVGLVPAPAAGQQGSFLRGDGTWDQMTASQITGLSASATTDTTNASNITSGTLAPARLPAPTSTTLGGVEAASGPSGQFMTGIGTSGVPQFGTPAYSQISGAPTLGSLASLSSVNNSNWSGAPLAISNGGTGQSTAIAAYNALSPMTTAGDIEYYSGSSAARLGVGSANQLLSVNSGATAPQWSSLSSLIDTLGTPAQGDILYRGASVWSLLAPGSTPSATLPGQFLQSQGSGANPQWASALSITGGTTYNIYHAGGGDFTDINAALTFFNNSYPNGAITLQLDAGTHTYTTNIYVGLNWAKKIKIQGATKTTVSVSSIQSTSGSSGNWSAVLNVSSTSGLATSTYACIYGASGGTNPELIQGCWPITAVDTVNNRITISLTTSWGSGAVASGAVTATADCLPTIIKFTGGTDGFDIWDGASAIQMKDVVIVGNGTTGGTSGLSVQDQGRLLGSGTIGLYNWGGAGIYANLQSHIFTSGNIIVSNCGAAGGGGACGIETDTAAAISANGYIVSNGNGGSGIVAQRGSSLQAAQSIDACGNTGNGFIISTNAAVNQTVSTAGRANGNGGYGYYLFEGGVIDCKTLWPANNTAGVKVLPIYYDNNNGTPINIAFGGKTNTTAQVTINAQSSGIDALDIYQGDGTTLVAGVTYAGQVFGSSLKAASGTSSQAPLTLTSGTNLTTATAGSTEYDGKIFYDTPVASGRCVRDIEQFSLVTSNISLSSSSTSAQSILPSGAQNFGIVSGCYYFFECVFLATLPNCGTYIPSFTLPTANSGTISGLNWSSKTGYTAPGSAGGNQSAHNSSSSNAILTSSTSYYIDSVIKGSFYCNAAGTIQPMITFSSAAGSGALVYPGTYFRLWCVGPNTSMGNLS